MRTGLYRHIGPSLVKATVSITCGLFIFAIVGCAVGYHPNSPDAVYSSRSTDNRELQVPPDLTSIADGEQFVVPGTSGDPMSRNMLLPALDSVRFVRESGQHWLSINAPVEAVWPQLLGFLREEKYRVARTQPTAGIVVTQWQPSGADQYRRVAFRLERDQNSSRVFARNQVATAEVALSDSAEQAVWPAQSHDSESTSLLLQQLLVYIGVSQQKANGLLNSQAAQGVLEDATLEVSASGSRLLLHAGYDSAFPLLRASLRRLGFGEQADAAAVPSAAYRSRSSQIRFSGSDEVVSGSDGIFLLRVDPLHAGAVRVSLLSAGGEPASASLARQIFELLQRDLA